MSSPASSDDGLDVVVDPDGALTVPADQLARHGVRPGSHLRVIFTDEPTAAAEVRVEVSPLKQARRSVRGSLAHLVTPADVDAFEAALAESKAARIAALDQ